METPTKLVRRIIGFPAAFLAEAPSRARQAGYPSLSAFVREAAVERLRAIKKALPPTPTKPITKKRT